MANTLQVSSRPPRPAWTSPPPRGSSAFTSNTCCRRAASRMVGAASAKPPYAAGHKGEIPRHRPACSGATLNGHRDRIPIKKAPSPVYPEKCVAHEDATSTTQQTLSQRAIFPPKKPHSGTSASPLLHPGCLFAKTVLTCLFSVVVAASRLT